MTPIDLSKDLNEWQQRRLSGLAEAIQRLGDHLGTLPAGRERSLAITKLEECAHWGSSCIVRGSE